MILAVVLLAILAFFLLIELYTLHQNITSDQSKLSPVTKFGKEIVSSFRFLEQRNAIKDSPEFRTSKKVEINSVVLSEGASFLSHLWKDSCVWIMLDDGRYGVSNSDYAKFIQIFKNSFSAFFQTKETQSLGIIQVNERISWGELLSAGIQVIAAESFPLSDNRYGICIVGGNNQNFFSAERIIEIKNVCRNLGKELLTLGEVHELTNTVTRLSKETAFAKDMVKHVSHDLRSPLHTLRLVLSTLPGDAKDDEIISAGLRSCDAAQSVVDSLLDLTRDNLDEKSVQFSNFSLEETIKEVVPIFKPLASLKNLKLHCNFSNLENDLVLSDKGLLKRIISNLISNAIKYTNSGSVNISLYNSNDAAIVEVQDTGIGMDSTEIAQIGASEVRFKPQIAEGLGVGFSATKKMIEMLKASIQIESTPSIGTTVRIIIPRKEKNVVGI